MKKSSYMSQNEYVQVLKLGVLSGEIQEWIDTTEDKTWRKMLKTCLTFLDRILIERLMHLDIKQRDSFDRKFRSCKIQLASYTNFFGTAQAKQEKRTVEIDAEDLYNLADFALTQCMLCPQGECVKNCEMRELYHRCYLEPTRTEVKEGECEFRFDNEVKAVSIKNRRQCVPML